MSKHSNNTNQIEAPTGGARPMKVFVDNHGNEWLCDKDVDANGSFAAQGCWRTDQMAFDRNC
jgi:streptogramin lyase